MGIDGIDLQFSSFSLTILNVIIGLIMFGVALDMRWDDFRRVGRTGRAAVVGLGSQFLILPALTFGLIWLLRPHPSMALGMLLVASCPGGTVSNFLTHLARGDTALSVSLSAVSTLAAALMTPFNLAFWGGLYEPTAQLLRQVALSPVDLLLTICTILVAPVLLGMTLAGRRPHWAAKARRPMRIFSLICLAGFVVVALAANFDIFLQHIGWVAGLVLLHNGVALASGYTLAGIAGLPESSRRAVTFEVGIQNSGLGLILIFDFFGGLGGMAIVAAWWGVWHLISGSLLATFWSRRPTTSAATSDAVLEAAR